MEVRQVVVVVGSDPVGLAAARVFQEAGESVLLLEASFAVGGAWVARRTQQHTGKVSLPCIPCGSGWTLPHT